MIALQGTGNLAGASDVERVMRGRFWTIEWGWRRNVLYSSKACGVSMSFSSKLFPMRETLRAVYSPPKLLAGRIGAVRLQLPFLDVLFVVFYFAPDPRNARHRKANVKIVEWIIKLVARMPKRCLIVFSADANAHVGYDADGNLGDPHIGDCDPVPENYNGKLFREMLIDAELTAINTMFPLGPTYYGHASATRVDYVGMSTKAVNMGTTLCWIDQRKADRLQPILINERREHRPIAWSIEHQLEYVKSPPMPLRYSQDMLMRAVCRGEHVQEFISAVASWAVQVLNSSAWTELIVQGSPTDAWEYVGEQLNDIALSIFADVNIYGKQYNIDKSEMHCILKLRRAQNGLI